MKKYLMSKGFMASEPMKAQLGIMGDIIARVADEQAAILGDKTMTRAQQSPALHKLKQAAEKALNKQLANAKQSLDLRLTSFDEAAHKALKGDLSTVEIAQLAKELRGMTSEERHETVKFSADFARASVLAPAALSGMSGTETGRGIFLKHHAPALLADLEQLEHDLRNIDAIAAHITSGLGELEINIDPQAMASQYRPALDRIDLEPRCGESQARYNERIA